MDIVLLIIAGAALLVGLTVFLILPDKLQIKDYESPVLGGLVGLVLAALGNVLAGLVHRQVTDQARVALNEPISHLHDAIQQLRQSQMFHEQGIAGVYANRASAMIEFQKEIEREDSTIDIVGTSLLGSLDPNEENHRRSSLHSLLLRKKKAGVRIRALLMHPAYGEFRERVENRERAAVAKDIQNTLRNLVWTGTKPLDSQDPLQTGGAHIPPKIFDLRDVHLYPGVVTAYAIFTSGSMLVNVSTLHGSVYDNLTLVVNDTEDPNSMFKKMRRHHFELPWGSEKTVNLTPDMLDTLLRIDFYEDAYRFSEGNWPATIRKDGPTPVADPESQRRASGSL